MLEGWPHLFCCHPKANRMLQSWTTIFLVGKVAFVPNGSDFSGLTMAALGPISQSRTTLMLRQSCAPPHIVSWAMARDVVSGRITGWSLRAYTTSSSAALSRANSSMSSSLGVDAHLGLLNSTTGSRIAAWPPALQRHRRPAKALLLATSWRPASLEAPEQHHVQRRGTLSWVPPQPHYRQGPPILYLLTIIVVKSDATIATNFFGLDCNLRLPTTVSEAQLHII